MSKLEVFRDGQKIQELDLTEERDWIVGRSSECDIVLEAERGISRQHFKLAFEEGRWVVHVLSRFGELYHNGHKVSSLPLVDGMRFEVPPFEFQFDCQEIKLEAEPEAQVIAPTYSEPVPPVDLADRTFVGNFSVHPYIKVTDEFGQTVQMFRLEGHAWVAGRDTSCALFIDNQKFSRRHFEIRLEEGTYLVMDLSSSNGTLLNGETLSTMNWTPLRSGDVLTVVDWNLQFELRDSSYESKLQEVPKELLNPMVYVPPSEENYTQSHHHQQMGPPPPIPQSVSSPKKKTNWVRTLIGVILIGGLAAYFYEPEKPTETTAPKAASTPFERLTPQQQQYVRDTYRLADRLYKEGRYEMARQEIAKVHELVPVFEESRRLEQYAGVAIQTQIDQQRAEARERDKLEIEEKILKTVAECQKLVDGNVQMQEIDNCLSPVIPLGPDHPSILALKAKVDQLIAERIERGERAAEYQALVRKQKSLYQKAVSLQEAGKPLEAIEALNAVVKSRLPDPENLKSQARRQMASIQQDLTTRQSTLQSEADAAAKKGDLKGAIVTLKKAHKINPQNETLKGQINSYLSELTKQMQILYQEGVLEESVGEIETAKSKWKKIIESSVPEESYYKKARSKIKKYEAG